MGALQQTLSQQEDRSHHKKMRTSFLFLLAFACTSHAQLTGCGSPEAAPVLNGVDIVATFAQAKAGTPTAPPVMGSSTFNHTDSEGFVFHFSSADNAAAYAASPTSYPVGAGGYCGLSISGGDPACSYQVCQGGACLTSASTYELASDGQLYFFLGPGAMRIFNEDGSKNTAGCAANIKAVQNLTKTTCWNTDKFNCHGGGPPSPPWCTNKCDDHPRMCHDVSCADLVKKYPCDQFYCDTCKYAGWCDKQCHTGACKRL